MKTLKKAIALLLVLAMSLSMMSLSVFAEDVVDTPSDDVETVEVATEPETPAVEEQAEPTEETTEETEAVEPAVEVEEETEAVEPAAEVEEETDEVEPAAEVEEETEEVEPAAEAEEETEAVEPEEEAEEVEEEVEEEKVEEKKEEPKPAQPELYPEINSIFSAAAGGYKVTVMVPAGSFAEDFTFRVFDPQLTAEEKAALGFAADDAVLDIGFENADGVEIEPVEGAQINVAINIAEVEAEAVEVYHVEDDEAVLVAESDGDVASFDVGSFSIFLFKKVDSGEVLVKLIRGEDRTEVVYKVGDTEQSYENGTAALTAALNEWKSGDEILVMPGEYDFNNLTSKIRDDFRMIGAGMDKVTFNTNGTGFTAKNIWIEGIKFQNMSGNAFYGAKFEGTFKDCEFYAPAANGLRCSYGNGGIAKFDGCTIYGKTYGVHFDGGTGSVEFNNCDLSGWNSMGGSLTSISFTDCKFHRTDYGQVRPYPNTTFVRCDFDANVCFDAPSTTGKTFIMRSCTAGDVPITKDNVIAEYSAVVASSVYTTNTLIVDDAMYDPVNETWIDAVAKIGDTPYFTLADAIAKIEDGDTIYVIADVTDAHGITTTPVNDKSFTVDFQNHTYLVVGPGAGSTGTETQAFQLTRKSNAQTPSVTFKNGTLEYAESVTGVKRMINNYVNLTLDNMTINASHQVGGEGYVLSFNNGNSVLQNGTKIITTNNDTIAFDVYDWPNGSYTNGSHVTIKEGVEINGIVEAAPDSQHRVSGSTLTIEGGTFGGLAISSYSASWVTITGGTFGTNPSAYVADGYGAHDNGDGSWTVGPLYTVSFNGNGGSTPASQNVVSGFTATAPAASRDGYLLTGWSLNGNAFDFATPITAPITLSAMWYFVGFDDDTGTATAAATPSETTSETASETTVEIEEEATPLAELPSDLASVTVTVNGEEVAVSDLQNIYVDVDSSNWAEEAINYVTALGIMNGVGATEEGNFFAPAATATGEMLTAMLYRAVSGEETKGENWSEAATEWASEISLTDGMNYSSDAALTREQMATMMYRIAESKGFDVSAKYDLGYVTDADDLSEYAQAAMEWAMAVGLIKGTGETTISPNMEITREQIALIMMRFNEMTNIKA